MVKGEVMEEWVVLIGIVFVASLLQASTGFGFSIVGTPFLFMIYSPHSAIQINIILSIFLSIFMMFNIRKDVDKHLLVRLIKGSFIGLLLGLLVYLFLDILWLKRMVGLLILILTILLVLRVTIHQTKKRDFLTGGISGLLTTSIGVPGPPLLLYFSGVGTQKAVLRSTALAYYLFIYSFSLALQIFFGGTSKEVWLSSFLAIPSLLLGIFLGQLLFKRISQNAFIRFTYLILFLTGTYLLITSF